ncbi:isopenicillin N synthase family dioxygenase [Luteibaculum oceani]|uniref:Isopenicillin N synthase family oxygenase n=1 Tax=Luteibaculum oceani TaxID=1294296 RepID=A0A5C6VA45_9FLAO|nr:2-oxoglutarate and iron-dependent oxygenase domain-containing protein [Luteibaculum oceani]TXC82117.1 isopenicillin N synthase family oxygenase [Luteibaculum oceani]
MSIVGIPVLKLEDFTGGSEQKRNEFIQNIGKAYTEIGFAAIEDHGISKKQISELYSAVKAFFKLPENIKKQYEIEGIAGQRGFTSFGKEHAKDSNVGDLKEFYHFGQEIDSKHPDYKNHLPNVYCEQVPEFNERCIAIYRDLEAMGAKILRAIAIYLNLDEHFFDSHIFHGNSILRPIHYPPITSAPKDAVRAAAHEDINLITLLIGSSADGLQVLSKNNEWIDIKAGEEMIVVNVGDMLQRLTNGKLSSTTHRVINPPREKWSQPRFSIPFFLHPRPEMPLNALPNCVTPGNPKIWDDITAGDYLTQRLKEIGLLK